jgi:GxxExxY protein
MQEESVCREVVDAALKVHTKLGPGLLEGAYEACLVYELSRRGLTARQQVSMPVQYDDIRLDVGYRIDVLVNECVVLELKCAEKLLPVHRAQLLTYLRLGAYRIGLLLNFHSTHMRDGLMRVINSNVPLCH